MTPVFALTPFSLTIPQTLVTYTETTSQMLSSTATTVMTSLASPQSSSAAEIGGIVGGVLGELLLSLEFSCSIFGVPESVSRTPRETISRSKVQNQGSQQ